MSVPPAAESFLRARDCLLRNRTDYAAAVSQFQWPVPDEFNWAIDYFDPMAAGSTRKALWVVRDDGSEVIRTFDELVSRSNQVANFLRALGVRRHDPLLLMLGNEVALWETLLACMKLGVVVIPATTLLTPGDIRDRFERGGVRHVVADAAALSKFDGLSQRFTGISVGGSAPGWRDFAESAGADASFVPDGVTRAQDPFLLYFTSGTTARPKLVLHTHQSYPVGHLSTMYWIGLQPGDLHWNISSPGWAKHAWSCVFAPWNAGATVFVMGYARFRAREVLEAVVRYGVTTLCAPPTVWRLLIQEPLQEFPVGLREVLSAGEPLNPEVIEQVRSAWGLTIRDGYGQTETTALVGNSPGQIVKPGSMGRPLPGHRLELIDAEGRSAGEGEVCVDIVHAGGSLMRGYVDDAAKTAEVMRGGLYHTGDVATRDAEGYVTFVGRADDVFKASDYRISPFELESVLIEHAAVAEAAVVPSPDALRQAVPKAFVALAAGHEPSRDLARDILSFANGALAPYKRIRLIEFCELPKTISGKIRRVDLRRQEAERRGSGARAPLEFFEDELRS
jgi:acetyl-CoA synthetase